MIAIADLELGKLTTAQRRAVTLDGPLIVSASAGAGKTRVLVERYVRLILSGCDIRRIVAITFTRKAAAEMLERTARRLEQLFEKASTPSELLLLRTVREQLTGAAISTFHSYCSSLLRRFPIEAQIPPTFGELSATDRRHIVRRAIRTVVEQWLTSEHRPKLAELVDVFGSYSNLEAALEQILGSPEQLDLIRHDDASDPAERIGTLLAQLTEKLSTFWGSLVAAAALDDEHTHKAPPIDRARQLFRDLAPHMHVSWTIGELDHVAPTLQDLCSLFHTSTGMLRAHWKPYASPILEREYSRRVELVRELIAADRHHEQRAWDAAVSMLSLARQALELIDQEKTLVAAFEPDDLQRLAVGFLERPDVVERLRRELRHILVDEFQDTNPMQYRLLEQLVPLEQAVPKPELFIVGDPKQSIYGFRGADVRVFERARQDITHAADTSHDVHLQTTFRMTPSLVAVVNHVMEQTMPPQTEGYFVGYEELCTARDPATCPPSYVGMLISTDSDAGLLAEARLVAAHIQRITASEPLTVWDERTGEFRHTQYRDIALLARKSAILEPYTYALREAGLPFRIESGRGFYQTQEILDIAAFLRLLHNVHDDVALAAVLRSPFVGLSDNDLAQIACAEPANGSFYERLRGYVQQTPSARHVAAALEMLEQLLPIAVRMPPTVLIRLLLRQTPWRTRIMSSPRARQIQANIEKLLEKARQFEQRGFRNLLDFVEELEQLRFVADTEAEAAVISDDNIITLMTIHAAKGLEFPIVYLVGTGESATGRSQPYYVTEELGIAITKVGTTQTATGKLARFLVRQREEAEEQRLLYVALTRAKDHLIIAGSLRQWESNGTQRLRVQGALATISAALEIDWNDQLGIRSRRITWEVRRDPSEQGTPVTVPIEICYELPFQQIQTSAVAPPAAALQIPEPIRSTVTGAIISASQLLLFQKSPKEFYRIYRCGLPSKEDTYQRALAALEDEDDVVGTYAGVLIHDGIALLLQVSPWDDSTLAQIIERVFHRHQSSDAGMLRRRVEQDLQAVAEFVRQHPVLASEQRRLYVERPLMIPVGEDFLLGVPDALVLTDNGWEVWDWKTNRRDQRSTAEWLKYYRTQLEVYVLLASFLAPEQQQFTARLIFTRPPVIVETLSFDRNSLEQIQARVAQTIAAIKRTSVNA